MSSRRSLGPRATPLIALGALALAAVLVGWMFYRATAAAAKRTDREQAAAIAALDKANARLASHGLPTVVPGPGTSGGAGGTGGPGGTGGGGGLGGPGGKGGTGGPGGLGGRGGNGAAVIVQLTPAPGPSGSPGAAGNDGAPGAEGSPGAQGPPGPDQCQWVDDPLRPGTQTCTRPSPTPEGTP